MWARWFNYRQIRALINNERLPGYWCTMWLSRTHTHFEFWVKDEIIKAKVGLRADNKRCIITGVLSLFLLICKANVFIFANYRFRLSVVHHVWWQVCRVLLILIYKHGGLWVYAVLWWWGVFSCHLLVCHGLVSCLIHNIDRIKDCDVSYIKLSV